MWQPLQRYSALAPEARKSFRRAVWLLPALGASLRMRGYKNTQQWLQTKLARQAVPSTPAKNPAERLEIICRMVRAASHYSLFHSSCLEQSLALWYLLERDGISAALRIGVRKEGEKFEAHAWVEHQGMALNQAEGQHQHYAPFDSELSKPPTEEA